MSQEKLLQGRCIVEGQVEGEALVTNDAISFMGTIDPKTGYVIERKHEIEGACLKGKILVFPMSKGSTGGRHRLRPPHGGPDRHLPDPDGGLHLSQRYGGHGAGGSQSHAGLTGAAAWEDFSR